MNPLDLQVVIEHPEAPRVAGEPVRGRVRVQANEAVTCKSLTVRTIWATHGRGNVQQGTVAERELAQGSWAAGALQEYPFELATPNWPPTYYGTYLNVSHFVQAEARIGRWKAPQTRREVRVICTSAPEDLKPTRPGVKQSRIVAVVLGIVVAAALSIPLLGLAAIVVPLVAVAAAIYWIVFRWMPGLLLGKVEASIEPLRLANGNKLNLRARVTPRRHVACEGITWTLAADEVVVSGSGSNRKTHQHRVFERTESLVEAGELAAGKPLDLRREFQLPAEAPPSLKFTDNELKSSAEFRVRIPSWPDWSKKFAFVVVPSGAGSAAARAGAEAPVPAAASADESGLSLNDVLDQVEKSYDDAPQLEQVLGAVIGLDFAARLNLQSEITTPASHPERHRGAWVLGEASGHEIPVAVYFPDPAAAPRVPQYAWQGRVNILGFDRELDCLMLEAGVA